MGSHVTRRRDEVGLQWWDESFTSVTFIPVMFYVDLILSELLYHDDGDCTYSMKNEVCILIFTRMWELPD
ncbi:hypothetical protein A4G99_13225 [Haladaptatus sp. R4]|nr:hypothetical protein A4G99_13225 [Haladaptatus sp. R4]